MGAIPFLLVIGALPSLAYQLPASCAGVGAASYSPPAVTIPAVTLNRGTVITVTNATVAVNGDTSSVAALVANPGPDGISIQEAIIATNNDPGTWNIQFAPALKGSIIDTGTSGLNALTGGNVTINGDINGDGQPDVTLTTTSQSTGTLGVSIYSGGNTLYALALQNFWYGVWISPPRLGVPVIGATFSNTTVSNLVLTGIQCTGIGVNPPSPSSADTQSNWDHILITGNTISGSAAGPALGIDMELGSAAGGDMWQHTTIANNKIMLPMPGAETVGIAMNVGNGLGANNNQALDTLIANNTVSVAPGTTGIRIAAGVGSGSANLMDGMQVIGNQIGVIGQTASANGLASGINLATGDAASDDVDVDPSLRPIQYSENNIARNITILSNTGGFPIFAQAACCGNANNTIDHLSILGNTLTGMQLVGGANGGYYSRPSTGNMLSNVLVQANTINSPPLPPSPPSPLPPTLADAVSQGGAITVIAGLGEPGNSVNGISIANNDVNTQLIGISIVAGWGFPPPPPVVGFSADNNVVSAAQIFCNQIDQAATAGPGGPYPQGVESINIVAALMNANGNQVQQLSVYDNPVAGVLANPSLFTYLGNGGSGNSISILQPSGPLNGPQIAGLVNAATFQQRALAPGSLVSLFGMNLSGATVQFSGVPAPILYASASQLNLQVPWELLGMSNSTVTVTANSISTDLESIPVGPADPGIFSLGAPQGGQGAIENVAGAVVNAGSPAHAGDYILIFATGLGAVTNTPQTGAAALQSPLSIVMQMTQPTATVGGVAAFVSFAGLAPGFVGVNQVNVQVPQGVAAGDAVPVTLLAGGFVSNTVIISVR
jgi:uncharacterized protein (TIGR03437 family)